MVKNCHNISSQIQAKIYHYRTNDKKEIDFIIEKADKIFAIEIKSSQSVKKRGFQAYNRFSKQVL